MKIKSIFTTLFTSSVVVFCSFASYAKCDRTLKSWYDYSSKVKISYCLNKNYDMQYSLWELKNLSKEKDIQVSFKRTCYDNSENILVKGDAYKVDVKAGQILTGGWTGTDLSDMIDMKEKKAKISHCEVDNGSIFVIDN